MHKPYLKSNNAFVKLCFVSLTICIGLIYGCRKDIAKINEKIPAEVAGPKFTDAKVWYEKMYPVNIAGKPLKITNSEEIDLSQKVKPDWEHPAAYTRLNKEVIEMPIDPDSKFGSLLKNTVNNKSYNKAYTRSSYIVLKDENGYEAYIMTIVADSAYINNDLSKLANNTYRKHDADFSGNVLYFTPKGSYLGGYSYQKGQLVTNASANEGATTQKVQNIKQDKLMPDNVVKECTDWYMVYFIDGVYQSDEYIGTTCINKNDGNTGDNGGAGGSAPAAPPAPPKCPAGSHAGPACNTTLYCSASFICWR